MMGHLVTMRTPVPILMNALVGYALGLHLLTIPHARMTRYVMVKKPVRVVNALGYHLLMILHALMMRYVMVKNPARLEYALLEKI